MSERTKRHPAPGTRTVRSLRLEVERGKDAPRTEERALGASVSVGTADDNDLVLTDPTVSRYHLELTGTAEGIRVTDLGSRNGTFVGTVRVLGATVPAGTDLTLGATVLRVTDGAAVEAQVDAAPEVPGMVAESEAMRAVARVTARVAQSGVAVLVQGETGTGKEVVARAIHDLSPRKGGPFVVVDCGSMPATLIASELFGHERGAFTGADRRHTGAFERAAGGTIFLDEIGELPVPVQAALLGVLERRKFRRVGGEQDLRSDVRVVAATHRDLRAEVNDDRFRADLYYRLAVARIVIPPLRERPEDVEALTRRFVEEVTGSPELPFGHATMEALRTHRWSGNVRELRNVVEAALAMGQVSLEETPARAGAPGAVDGPLRTYKDARAEVLARFEKEYLGRLMAECDGNASEAARRAQMDRQYLLRILRRHDLR